MSQGWSKHGDGTTLMTFRGKAYVPVNKVRRSNTVKQNGQYPIPKLSKNNRVENESRAEVSN